jgi:hypothetical protein
VKCLFFLLAMMSPDFAMRAVCACRQAEFPPQSPPHCEFHYALIAISRTAPQIVDMLRPDPDANRAPDRVAVDHRLGWLSLWATTLKILRPV